MRGAHHKRIAPILVSVALALGVGVAPLPATAANGVTAIEVSCKKAKIGGKRKCIAAGQFCARKYERDYNKYGYTCSKKDRNGRYHLKKL